ncbi:MAG TPA: CoA transferase [Dehalococcoidia bacterium]|nr:CoA transferase [Dehalococcoidia bacterium]
MSESSGLPAALAGLRLLDLTDASGAYGVRLLADLGAEVLRIEPPGASTDGTLGTGEKGTPVTTAGLAARYDNLAKRSLTLNLDEPDGQKLLRRLAETADALIETSPPGHLADRGLGYPDLAAVNPRLVYTSLTPFGQAGPYAEFRQTPLTALALGGLLSTMGLPEGPPVQAGVPLAYLLAGQHAAAFTQIALIGRRLTGRGQHVDVSVQACVAAAVEGPLQIYLMTGQAYPRIGAQRRLEPPNGTYACADGYFCIFVLDWPAFARWVCEVLGDDELLDPKYEGATNALRAPHAEAIIPRVQEFALRLTRAELLEGAHRTGQIGGSVLTPDEVLADPHLADRNFFRTIDWPDQGPVQIPGAPYRLAATPWRTPAPPVAPGADNEAIFQDELGLSPADLDRLRRSGVI